MSSDTDGVIVHDTLCLSDEDVNSSVTSGISSASDNLNIGQPSVNYYVYESFYYSHNYFRRGPEGLEVAECLLCLRDKKEDRNPFKKRKLNVKTTNGSPKGMIAHLNAFHPEYNEKINQQKLVHEQKKAALKEKCRGNKSGGDGLKQSKLGFGTASTLSIENRHDPKYQQRWDEATVLFISKTFVSFNAMSKSDILLKAIWPDSQPKIKAKSNQSISRDVKKMSQILVKNIISIIHSSKEDCTAYSFTSDIWRNRSLDSFISLTVHFINKDMKLIKFVPFCEYFGKRRHTGKNIKITLDKLIDILGVSEDDIVKNVILDNASNNKLAIKMSPGLEGYYCNIHSLQLCVRDVFKTTVQTIEVKKVIAKCQDLAKFVRMSEKRNNELKESCQKTNIAYKLPQKHNATRWNSMEMCVSSVIYLKPALQFLANHEDDWDEKVLSLHEFKVAETIVKVLQCIKRVSKLWEADLTPTIHLVVRELYNVRSVLETFEASTDKYVANFACELKKHINRRFPNVGTGIIINSVGHFLDPEYRGAILQEYPGSYVAAQEKIIQIASKFCGDVTITSNVASEPQTSNVEVDDSLTPAQKLLLRQRQSQNNSFQGVSRSNSNNANLNIETELQKYENMVIIGNTKDVLKWWFDSREKFPILVKVVREIFSIPASSATSERAFSSGTQVRY